eukprot:m.77453 g.77453  ORF g.77453 m.77453 type:complete len:1440 (-) comp14547_c1_seq1:404-4723(-)
MSLLDSSYSVRHRDTHVSTMSDSQSAASLRRTNEDMRRRIADLKANLAKERNRAKEAHRQKVYAVNQARIQAESDKNRSLSEQQQRLHKEQSRVLATETQRLTRHQERELDSVTKLRDEEEFRRQKRLEEEQAAHERLLRQQTRLQVQEELEQTMGRENQQLRDELYELQEQHRKLERLYQVKVESEAEKAETIRRWEIEKKKEIEALDRQGRSTVRKEMQEKRDRENTIRKLEEEISTLRRKSMMLEADKGELTAELKRHKEAESWSRRTPKKVGKSMGVYDPALTGGGSLIMSTPRRTPARSNSTRPQSSSRAQAARETRENRELAAKVKALAAENDALKRDVDTLRHPSNQDKLDQLAQRNVELTAQLARSKKRCKEFEAKMRDLSARAIKLEDELQREKAQNQRLARSQSRRSSDDFRTKARELEGLQQRFDDLMKRHADQQQSLQDRDHELARLRGEVRKLSSAREALQTRLDVVSKAQTQQSDAANADLKRQFGTLQKEHTKLQQKFSALQAASKKPKEDPSAAALQDLKGKFASLKSEKSQLDKKIRALEQGNKTLQDELHEARSAKAQVQRFKSDQAVLEGTIDTLKDENSRLKDQLQTVRAADGQNTQALDQLEDRLRQAEDALQQAREEKAKSDRTANEFQDALNAKTEALALLEDEAVILREAAAAAATAEPVASAAPVGKSLMDELAEGAQELVDQYDQSDADEVEEEFYDDDDDGDKSASQPDEDEDQDKYQNEDQYDDDIDFEDEDEDDMLPDGSPTKTGGAADAMQRLEEAAAQRQAEAEDKVRRHREEREAQERAERQREEEAHQKQLEDAAEREGEADRQRKAEEETRLQLEEAAERDAEAERVRQAEAEARRKAEEEEEEAERQRKAQAEAEAERQRQAEAAAEAKRVAQEAEAKRAAEEEERLKAEREAEAQRQEAARLEAEREAEARRQAEQAAEAQRLAAAEEEAARLAAEAEEARLQAEAEEAAGAGAEADEAEARYFRVLYDYDPRQGPNDEFDDELVLIEGAFLKMMTDIDEDGFFEAENNQGRVGLVPSNFVEELPKEEAQALGLVPSLPPKGAVTAKSQENPVAAQAAAVAQGRVRPVSGLDDILPVPSYVKVSKTYEDCVWLTWEVGTSTESIDGFELLVDDQVEAQVKGGASRSGSVRYSFHPGMSYSLSVRSYMGDSYSVASASIPYSATGNEESESEDTAAPEEFDWDNARVTYYTVIYDYNPFEESPNENPEEELALQVGQVIKVYGEMGEDMFFQAELNGKRGLVPSNYLEPTPGGEAAFAAAAAAAPVSEDDVTDEMDGEPEIPPETVDFQPGTLVVAQFDYVPEELSPNDDGLDEELAFNAGDLIKILEPIDEDGFYLAQHRATGREGVVPCNFIKLYDKDEEMASVAAAQQQPTDSEPASDSDTDGRKKKKPKGGFFSRFGRKH